MAAYFVHEYRACMLCCNWPFGCSFGTAINNKNSNKRSLNFTWRLWPKHVEFYDNRYFYNKNACIYCTIIFIRLTKRNGTSSFNTQISVRTSQKTQFLPIIKNTWVIVLRAIIGIYFETLTKCMNTLCGRMQFLNVTSVWYTQTHIKWSLVFFLSPDPEVT
jgi:hypothetical protein